jgi:hypothetical protein
VSTQRHRSNARCKLAGRRDIHHLSSRTPES